jgi:hypothetical protein
MKPRIEKTGSPETIVYFCIRFCRFWPFGIWIQYPVWILGLKFTMPRRFLWLFCCLDLSPGSVCFETFDYLRMPHQRAFDPIFYFFVKSPPIARTLTPRD